MSLGTSWIGERLQTPLAFNGPCVIYTYSQAAHELVLGLYKDILCRAAALR